MTSRMNGTTEIESLDESGLSPTVTMDQTGSEQTMIKSIMAAVKSLNLYAEGVILYSGIVSNLLILAVFWRMKRTSWNWYIRALAVIDLLILTVALQTHWVNYNFRPKGKNPTLCTYMLFTVQTLSGCEAWTIVALTVDRFVAVKFPFKAMENGRLVKTNIILCLIFLVSALKNIICFFKAGFALDQNSQMMTCFLLYGNEALVDIIYPWVDLLFDSVCPSVLILVFNIAIIIVLIKGVKERAELTANLMRKSAIVKEQKAAVVLLIISFMFLILTSPRRLFVAVWPLANPTSTPMNSAWFLLIHTVTHKLWYLNCAINFYLYCASASGFRSSLVAFFSCRGTIPKNE